MANANDKSTKGGVTHTFDVGLDAYIAKHDDTGIYSIKGPVADLAALRLLDTTILQENPSGCMCRLADGTEYVLNRDSVEVDNADTVIEPTVGVGAWEKKTVSAGTYTEYADIAAVETDAANIALYAEVLTLDNNNLYRRIDTTTGLIVDFVFLHRLGATTNYVIETYADQATMLADIANILVNSECKLTDSGKVYKRIADTAGNITDFLFLYYIAADALLFSDATTDIDDITVYGKNRKTVAYSWGTAIPVSGNGTILETVSRELGSTGTFIRTVQKAYDKDTGRAWQRFYTSELAGWTTWKNIDATVQLAFNDNTTDIDDITLYGANQTTVAYSYGVKVPNTGNGTFITTSQRQNADGTFARYYQSAFDKDAMRAYRRQYTNETAVWTDWTCTTIRNLTYADQATMLADIANIGKDDTCFITDTGKVWLRSVITANDITDFTFLYYVGSKGTALIYNDNTTDIDLLPQYGINKTTTGYSWGTKVPASGNGTYITTSQRQNPDGGFVRYYQSAFDKDNTCKYSRQWTIETAVWSDWKLAGIDDSVKASTTQSYSIDKIKQVANGFSASLPRKLITTTDNGTTLSADYNLFITNSTMTATNVNVDVANYGVGDEIEIDHTNNYIDFTVTCIGGTFKNATSRSSSDTATVTTIPEGGKVRLKFNGTSVYVEKLSPPSSSDILLVHNSYFYTNTDLGSGAGIIPAPSISGYGFYKIEYKIGASVFRVVTYKISTPVLHEGFIYQDNGVNNGGDIYMAMFEVLKGGSTFTLYKAAYKNINTLVGSDTTSNGISRIWYTKNP